MKTITLKQLKENATILRLSLMDLEGIIKDWSDVARNLLESGVDEDLIWDFENNYVTNEYLKDRLEDSFTIIREILEFVEIESKD